jgi:enediyne biosynthesis protein E4
MIKKVSIISFLAFSLPLWLFAQGGASTGEAKIYTSKRTTGIVDEKAPKVFEDVTATTALRDFKCISGTPNKEYIVETTACVVAVLDYDNDGKPDIFLLNGSTINAQKGNEPPPRSALYRNLGNWKFEDVTEKAGVANERWGMGVTVGDYDNDGFADLFVSNYGTSRLYHNNGNGTFTDLAEKVGLNIQGWFTGATFGDYDKDGRLDLFVPSYLEFDLAQLPPSPMDVDKGASVGRNFCQFRGQPVMCGPRGLKGGKDRLFHQKADGTFEDVGDKVGVIDELRGYGFSSVFVDIDDDKDLDLLVVNDSTPKQLYLNKGNGNFEEIGYPSGIALNENGREQAGMGLAVGDYDNDGKVDFHITNFSDDSNTLYRNDGDDNFTDITFQAGLGEPTIPFLGWATSFFDYDNDGWKDVLVINGHVYPAVDKFQWGTSFAQQILLFKNGKAQANGQLRFERVSAAPNSGLAESFVGRGAAISDFDGDGKLDVIVNVMDGSPALLKNVTASSSHWLALKLIGDTAQKTPKDAIGSCVFVTTGALRQRLDLVSGAGYASNNDQTIHIGLGAVTRIDKLEIVWANGQTEVVPVDKIDTSLTIKQGAGVTAVNSMDKIGVPECDEYMEKYEACIMAKVPEASRPAFKSQIAQSKKAWKDAASYSPETKASLAQSCKTALIAAKESTAAFGCKW